MAAMTNLERLKIELKGVTIPDTEFKVYLEENGMIADGDYSPAHKTYQKQILQTALAILEMLANDVTNMGDYKIENVSSDNYHKHLMDRIRHLEVKIRGIKTENDIEEASTTFVLWD